MATPTSTRTVNVPIRSSRTDSGPVLGPAPNLTDWVDEPTVLKLTEDLTMAQSGHDNTVTKIERWLKLREAAPKARKDPKQNVNRSTVQPKLVRRQAEWRYSALSEPFLNAEKLFTVAPRTHMDVAAARQNELLLNWQFSTVIPRVAFIDEYVRTAVDEGTVVMRPGWVRETRIDKALVNKWSFRSGGSPEEMEALSQAGQLREQDPIAFEELDEQLRVSVEQTIQLGQPVFAVHAGTEEVEEEVLLKNHPRVDILDIRNVYFDPSCEGDITKANFSVISFETSQAELRADGRYQNLDFVNWSSASVLHQPMHTTTEIGHAGFSDELRKRVVAFEYWGFRDIDGSGTLTPIVATWIGQTMIRMELNPYPDQKIPLVVARYMPVRKSVSGEADAELLEDNQQILGALTRGMIDLLGRSANGQTGFAKGMLDTVNRRRYDAGQDYEFNPNQPPATGINQHKFPELPQSALVMLQLQNQEAEALTGVKAFAGGLSGDALGDVATAVRGVLDAASKREMGILRRLTAGMEELGRKIIAMNVTFLTEAEVIRVTDEEFVTITQDSLRGEVDLKVAISTNEIDEARAQDLGFMLQTLGNTVPWEITQMILAEIADLKRMPALAYAIRQFTPQPNPLAQKREELEIAKLEMEIAEMQAQTALAQAKARESQTKARLNLAQADQADLDFVEQETGTKHLRDLDKQGEQANAQARLAIISEAARAKSQSEIERNKPQKSN